MANIGFDHYNKWILHDETDTSIGVQEIYDKVKDEEDFPHIAMTTPVIATATGKDDLGASEFTAITLTLRNNWQFKCRTSPVSDVVIKISGGNTIAESGNDRFFPVENVHYEFGQSTAPAAIVTGGLTPTQAQIREAMTLATGLTPATNSIDDYLLDIKKIQNNTQEWVSPGLVKVYDDGETIGGTTYAEFETRDSLGVQTFDISKVKQYVRTK